MYTRSSSIAIFRSPHTYMESICQLRTIVRRWLQEHQMLDCDNFTVPRTNHSGVDHFFSSKILVNNINHHPIKIFFEETPPGSPPKYAPEYPRRDPGGTRGVPRKQLPGNPPDSPRFRSCFSGVPVNYTPGTSQTAPSKSGKDPNCSGKDLLISFA